MGIRRTLAVVRHSHPHTTAGSPKDVQMNAIHAVQFGPAVQFAHAVQFGRTGQFVPVSERRS